MAFEYVTVEGAFTGDTEATVRAWPGGSVEQSILIGFSWRNTESVPTDRTYLLRHKVTSGSVYSGGHQETVPAGQTAKGYVAGMLSMDAAGESIVVTLGSGESGTYRWQALFRDQVPDA